MLVINVRRDGVDIVVSLNVGRIIVTLHVLRDGGVAALATRNGGDHWIRAVLDDAILHAQLEKDILERAQSVQGKQVMWRLFSKQVTRTHQSNLEIPKKLSLESRKV